jgi:hypothetical protein
MWPWLYLFHTHPTPHYLLFRFLGTALGYFSFQNIFGKFGQAKKEASKFFSGLRSTQTRFHVIPERSTQSKLSARLTTQSPKLIWALELYRFLALVTRRRRSQG